jgi:hypothetical protein
MKLTGDRCQCTACGQFFPTTRTFDAHRTGTFSPLKRGCKIPSKLALRPPVSACFVKGAQKLVSA